MTNTFKLKRRTSGAAGSPASLKSGELAHNETENILYIGKGDNGGGTATAIVPVAGAGAFSVLGHEHTLSEISDAGTAAALNVAVSNTEPVAPAVGDLWASEDTRPNPVLSVVEGSGISVDNTDPLNPIVAMDRALAGFRNKIINGNFDVWQRGTSFTSVGYTADRWAVTSPVGTPTFSLQKNLIPVGSVLDSAAEIYINQTAGIGPVYIYQRIEGVRTLSGKTVTLSVWAIDKGNNPGIKVLAQQYFGISGSATVVALSQAQAITGNYTRYDFVFTMPSVLGKTIGANDSINIVIYNNQADNAVNTFPSTLGLTRISLVEGDVSGEADPFSSRQIQQELALCQRYYEIGYMIFSGAVTADSVYYTYTPFKVAKRVSPTLSGVGQSEFSFPSGAPTLGYYGEGVRSNKTASGTAVGGFFDFIWIADAEF